jgi:hypothetical protein
MGIVRTVIRTIIEAELCDWSLDGPQGLEYGD